MIGQLIFAVAAAALAIPSPITPDPNGDKNVGNGQGLQFITGACSSTKDCNQNAVPSCCAFIAGSSSTGICSGIAVASANGKAGCGFGDSGASAAQQPAFDSGFGVVNSAPAPSPEMPKPAPAVKSPPPKVVAAAEACTVNEALSGSQNVGLGTGVQFITGQCLSPADCQSKCCVTQPGGVALCKAVIPTEEAGLTCDFSCTT